jgi:hypothetical protein
MQRWLFFELLSASWTFAECKRTSHSWQFANNPAEQLLEGRLFWFILASRRVHLLILLNTPKVCRVKCVGVDENKITPLFLVGNSTSPCVVAQASRLHSRRTSYRSTRQGRPSTTSIPSRRSLQLQTLWSVCSVRPRRCCRLSGKVFTRTRWRPSCSCD